MADDSQPVKRFVFWSPTYAAVAVLGICFVAFWASIGVGGWVVRALLLIPTLLVVALQRRARVSLALADGELLVRRGLGPAQRIELPGSDAAQGATPYRQNEALPAVSRASIQLGDDENLLPRNSVRRGMRRLKRVVDVLFLVMGNGLWPRTGPHHREPMARIKLKDASAEVHSVLLPAKGTRNQEKLEAFAAALGPATRVDDETSDS